MDEKTTKPNIESSTNSGPNFEPHVAATLAYLLPPITGIVFYLIEKENKFVRFHAMQSILFGAVCIVASIISNALISVFIGLLLAPVVSIASFVLWLMLMWKAYNKQEYMLPYLGKIAKDQIK